jgi:hypothetical protein
MSNLDSGLDQDVEPGRVESGGEVTGPIESSLAPGTEPSAAPVADINLPIDLDLIERDLRDVETTLARLADGTYFTEPPESVPVPDAAPSSTDSGLEP